MVEVWMEKAEAQFLLGLLSCGSCTVVSICSCWNMSSSILDYRLLVTELELLVFVKGLIS